MKEICFLCEEPAIATCQRCCRVSFCSDQHRALHEDGAQCLPFLVTSREGVGRCVMAARDIAPGELIFREEAVAIGPNHDTPPLCLSCLQVLSEDAYLCPECEVPVCDEKCAAGIHRQLECEVMARHKGKLRIRDMDGATLHPFYQCIAPLRCLLVKQKDKVKWNTLQLMMDHNEERRHISHWGVCQHNIVKHLREFWELDFTEEEINHVIGLIEVNAFEIKLRQKTKEGDISQLGVGRGVFPLLAKLSHECVSNCRYDNVGDGRVMECRATVAIREGEQIIDHYVSLMESTVKRREALSVGWYFWCECARCRDKTELGTHLSSLRCSGLSQRLGSYTGAGLGGAGAGDCGGLVMASDPGDPDTEWGCEACGVTYSGALVTGLLAEVAEMTEMTGQADLGGLEFLVTMYEGSLHPRHAVMLTIKRFLIYIYGRSAEASQPEQLQRKIEYCTQILEACDVIMPGLTKERGLTLYELVVASLALGEKQPEEMVDSLRDAAACLQWERSGTFEHRIKTKVQEMLQYLDVDLSTKG